MISNGVGNEVQALTTQPYNIKNLKVTIPSQGLHVPAEVTVTVTVWSTQSPPSLAIPRSGLKELTISIALRSSRMSSLILGSCVATTGWLVLGLICLFLLLIV